MRLAALILAACLGPAAALAEEPTSLVAGLEWSGNLDAKLGLLRGREDALAYRLNLGQAGLSQPLSQYGIEPYLNADYASREVGFHAKGHGILDGRSTGSFRLLELYGNLAPDLHWSLTAGRRAFSWGKGYAFNPVGYVNPAKDPENPESPQAGLDSLAVEYTKSLGLRALETVSGLAILILPAPVAGPIGEAQRAELALKAYALVWDSDLDLMGYYGPAGLQRVGLDLSRNLGTNLELHGELDYARSGPGALSWLAGLRYLSAANTTAIAEYYHNAGGLSRDGFRAYQGFLKDALDSGQALRIQAAAEAAKSVLQKPALMQDYAYVKLTQPEPFGWVHFTPSLYSVINLQDGSFTVAAPLSYKPFTDFELILWPSLFAGPGDSEFGGKQVEQRYEAWFRFYFG